MPDRTWPPPPLLLRRTSDERSRGPGDQSVSVGEWEGEQQVQYFRKENSVYRKLVFSRGRLTGFLLAGDIRGAGILTSFVKNETGLSPSALEEGLEQGFSFSPRLRVLGGAIQSRGRENC